MRLYDRKEFIRLPNNTIYSKVDDDISSLMCGLYCKTSDSDDYDNDWIEQDLIDEVGYPNNINDGMDALMYQLTLRNNYKDFRTDLECAGRDGRFETTDKFIVWDKHDITKLYKYLENILNNLK